MANETSVPSVAPEVFPQHAPEKGMFISMGPQHPSTHGVLRVAITTDGEIVTSAQPRFAATEKADAGSDRFRALAVDLS